MNSNLMRKVKKSKAGSKPQPPGLTQQPIPQQSQPQQQPQQPLMFRRMTGDFEPHNEIYNTAAGPNSQRYPPGIMNSPAPGSPYPQATNPEETMADPRDPFWMRRRYTREDSFPELADLDLSSPPEPPVANTPLPQPPVVQLPAQRMPVQKKDVPSVPPSYSQNNYNQNPPPMANPSQNIPAFKSPTNFRPPNIPQTSQWSMNTNQTLNQPPSAPELWQSNGDVNQSTRGKSHKAKKVKVKKHHNNPNTPTFNQQPQPPMNISSNMAPARFSPQVPVPRPTENSGGYKPVPNPALQQRQPGSSSADFNNVLMSRNFAENKSRVNVNTAPPPMPPPKVKSNNNLNNNFYNPNGY